MRSLKLFGFLLFAYLLIGQPSSAQGVFDLGPLSGSIKKSGVILAEPAAPQQVKQAVTTDFTFKVSASLRLENMNKFIEGLRQQDPGAADMLKGQNLVATIAPDLKAVGLNVDDMADAYTMWMLSAYGLYRDIEEDATPRQIAGSRKMVAATMAGSPDILSAPDADKQKLAEALFLQAILNTWIAERLKEAPELKPSFQQEFYRSAKADMGIDLARFDWNEDGLYAKPE